MADLVPGKFSVDDLGVYAGFVRADDDRGSHVRPFFTFDTAQEIAADWVEFEGMPDEPPPQAFYDSERDSFRMFEPATREWHELPGERYGPNTLYAMGHELWTWRRAKGN